MTTYDLNVWDWIGHETDYSAECWRIDISGWDSDLRKTNLVGYDLVDGYLCRECLEVE